MGVCDWARAESRQESQRAQAERAEPEASRAEQGAPAPGARQGQMALPDDVLLGLIPIITCCVDRALASWGVAPWRQTESSSACRR